MTVVHYRFAGYSYKLESTQAYLVATAKQNVLVSQPGSVSRVD